ncbi:hypothetical protein AHF37_02985 [Paragonimus kellicotti]|nr:hypothetical protein AHF37_02985 [Paragonimus kellicotti]
MRQRGATATAFSPGLYMDAIRALGSTSSASAVPPPTEASVGASATDAFAASTLSPKLISISPVLSRIQSPLTIANNSTRLLQTHSSEAYVYNRRTSTDLPESDCASKIAAHNRALFDAKLRKKHKTRRAGLHQINGDVGRSLHSLKMTIRRTSQSHKVHPSPPLHFELCTYRKKSDVPFSVLVVLHPHLTRSNRMRTKRNQALRSITLTLALPP